MKTKRRLAIAGIVAGSLLSLAPVLGIAGTVIGMIRSFNTLGQSGIADPKALADSIGVTLYSTAAGFFLFPLGLVILTVSIIAHSQIRKASPPPLPPPPIA